ncbi:MAG: septum formation protein Maf [Bdellovibrionales bacterium]|nr:septum formation protein Maf [Bdellovibrionales bacterium]
MKNFILVSSSPRRKLLLEEAGFKFTIDHVKVSEIINENLNARENAESLARLKAKSYVNSNNLLKLKDNLVITADTLVAYEKTILGKPKNFSEAVEILSLLSSKTHSVITAFCIYDSSVDQYFIYSDETFVEFRDLSEEEILEYVRSGEPMDKAGSYGIQGEARKFVKRVNGSLSNVIGFPLELFELQVKNHGWKLCCE